MVEIFTCTVSSEFLTLMRDLLKQYQLQAKEIAGTQLTDFEIQLSTPEDGRKIVRLRNEFNRKVSDSFLNEYAEVLRQQRDDRLRRINFWRRLTFRQPLK